MSEPLIWAGIAALKKRQALAFNYRSFLGIRPVSFARFQVITPQPLAPEGERWA